jgi:Flp pilus assembly protein TadD
VNRFFFLALIIGLVPGIILPSQSVIALESSEIAAKAKEFTVQIDGEESGTGTIIEHQGTSYTVITCWHVLDTPGNYQVITLDGQQYQATEIKNLPNADLATIKFTSSNTYQTAELGNSQAVTPGTSAYVVGYPDPRPGIPERAYVFSNADVVSQLTKGEKGYTIIHDKPSTPGGSGGGIFDVNGSLIGINGRSISDGNTNQVVGAGIPLKLYLATRSDLVVPTNITPPQDFVSVGQRKLKAKDYQGAVNEFSQALATNPNDLDAYLGRGTSYSNLKENDKAIADFTEAIRLNPELGEAYLNRGLTYMFLDEHDKGIADYTEAIRLNPNDRNAYVLRGSFYIGLEEYDQAISDFTEAIRLNPKQPGSYLVRGDIYGKLGEYDQAITDFNEAIRLNPEDADSYKHRGAIYYFQEEDDKASVDLYKAADLYQQQGDTEGYQKTLSLIEDWNL